MAPIRLLRGGLPPSALDSLLHPRDPPPPSPPPPSALRPRAAPSRGALGPPPARTAPSGATRALGARQDAAAATTSTVPGHYPALHSSLAPGTVAGIVLGSVAGFLLLLWLLYTCMNFGNAPDGESYGTASVVTRHTDRRSRSRGAGAGAAERPRRHHRHRAGGASHRETVEVRTTSVRPGERIVVDEGARRSGGSRAPSAAPPPPPPPQPRVVSEDDEVVVIEEHSPPRRHRSGRRRSSGGGGGGGHHAPRRESGGYYRDVDPDRFAGGDAPPRPVRGPGRR